MSYENLLVDIKDRVAVLSINRPKVLNALSSQTLRELHAALDDLGERAEVRVLIVTGAGEKAFVAGADIAEMQDMSPEQVYGYSDLGLRLTQKMQALAKPILGVVNGYALGGGMELAMACDIIFAAESAKFGQPEINLAVTPGFGGTQRLARIVGRCKALELLLTGDTITAQEAHEVGIVNRVFPGDNLMAASLEVAQKMAMRGAFALAQIKRAVYAGLDMPLASALAFEKQVFSLCFSTPDQKEGMRAFIEKRKPEFR